MSWELGEREKEEIRKEGEEDPVFFTRFFLPELFELVEERDGEVFYRDTPTVHWGILSLFTRKTEFLQKLPKDEQDFLLEIFQEWEDWRDPESKRTPIFSRKPNGQFVLHAKNKAVLVFPRGFAKTTIVGNAVPIWKICYKQAKHILYLSKTDSHARDQIITIQRQLENNPRLISVFGEFRPPRESGLRWAQDVFQTLNDQIVSAKGAGGQVRGQKKSAGLYAHRPNSIILDDVENDESVSTEEQRVKRRIWYYREVQQALKWEPNSTINAIGTKLHNEDLLMTMTRDPQFSSVMINATTDDGRMLWPYRMGKEKFNKEMESFRKAGDLAGFYNEYLPSQKAPPEVALFPAGKIIRGPRPKMDDLRLSIGVDPAISEKRGADHAVVATVGLAPGGIYYVLNMWGGRGKKPHEIVDAVFEQVLWWGGGVRGVDVAVEAVAYQSSLYQTIKEKMHLEKAYARVTPLHHKQNKISRIKGTLGPKYHNEQVIHCGDFPDLVRQLVEFPADKDDYPDALAMAVNILEKYAGLANDPNKKTCHESERRNPAEDLKRFRRNGAP